MQTENKMIEKTQKFLALDLELNQPSGKIIQVGVAIGSANDKFENYITKKWYIDPNEPISEFIIGLTGITDHDIRLNCVSHETVARELGEVIKKYNTWINPITWGGGDSRELMDEFSAHCVDFPHFGRRWVDVKTFVTFDRFSKNKNPSGGLSSAMGEYKMQFKGTAHRADIDAVNTLAFFHKLVDNQRLMHAAVQTAKVCL
jgi:inhibitor of KinA sporulation pathway (predicted exonuclease)